MAKNDQKCQISLKTMVKRRVIKFDGAWNYSAQNLVSSANFKFWPANYGDGISFGHYDMKFGGKSQNGKK